MPFPVNRLGALLVVFVSCKSSDTPTPLPTPARTLPTASLLLDAPSVAPNPTSSAPAAVNQLLEQMFGKPSPDAGADQLDKLRAIANTSPAAERPLIDKMLHFAEYAAQDPKDYGEINRRYVGLVVDLVPTISKSDFKLALKLAVSTYQSWSSSRYHGEFDLDAQVVKLYTDLSTNFPDEPLPQLLLARLDRDAGLDNLRGLAAAKHCIEHVAKAEAQFRAPLAQECSQLHGEIAAALTAPRCKSVRNDLVFFRGGTRKSEFNPTKAIVVHKQPFYRQEKPLLDSSHIVVAVQKGPSIQFQLDAQAAQAVEDLRAGVSDEDDWIIVEAGGQPLLAGGADLNFGRLEVVGTTGHAQKLELVCKTPIERGLVPPKLELAK